MNAAMLISQTAQQKGFGTDKWKRVFGLTAEERAAARAGTPVYFRSSRLSGGNHGTYWRRAVWNHGFGFVPRVPAFDVVETLETAQ